METIILWFVESNIAIIALYMFYRLFLHHDTFFKEKRFAFIAGLLFAILYPLIDLSSVIQQSHGATSIAQTLSISLPEISITANAKNEIATVNLLLLTYFIGFAGFLIRFLYQIGSVLVLKSKCSQTCVNGQKIIRLPKGSAPFSFFGWIFLHPEDHSTRDLEEIILHEKSHSHQIHTLDVLFSELVCMVFWCNPFAWLLKIHIRENLEFLADKNVIHSGFDPKSYQYHLLRLSYQQSASKVGNNFNVSQLKNRIIMMNKKKTSLAGLCKYALSLPLFTLLFISAYAWGAKQINPPLKEIASVSTKQTDNTTTITPQKAKKQTETKKDSITITVHDIKTDNTKTDEIKEISDVVVVAYAPEEPNKTTASDTPLLSVDQMPQYPGGENELMKYIGEKLRYPQIAIKNKIEGRLTIRFVVSKTGDVKDVEVLRSLYPACDEEGMRIVRLMPKWIPGKQDGKDVDVYFTLPILFRLQKK